MKKTKLKKLIKELYKYEVANIDLAKKIDKVIIPLEEYLDTIK